MITRQSAGALTRAHTQDTEREIPYGGRVGGSGARWSPCPARDLCLVPCGQNVLKPRSTLSTPCGFELCGTVNHCPKRVRLQAGEAPEEVTR